MTDPAQRHPAFPSYAMLPRGTRLTPALFEAVADLQYWFYIGGVHDTTERETDLTEERILDSQQLAQQDIIRAFKAATYTPPERADTDPAVPEWIPLTLGTLKVFPSGRGHVDIRYTNGSLRLDQPKSALRQPWSYAARAPTPTHWRPSKPKKDTL